MRPLVWFRSDLRLADNPALTAATRRANDCVGIFICTPGQWEQHDWGSAKVDFLLRHLATLSSSLAEIGVPLLLREVRTFSEVPGLLEQLALTYECDALFFNREYEVNERRRDRAVVDRFHALSIRTHLFDDQTVLAPGQLLTGKGAFYSVFTPFRRRWSQELLDRGLPDLAPVPPSRESPRSPSPDAVPRSLQGFEEARQLSQEWPAGEAQALRRLHRFLDERAHSYHETRDVPDSDSTSRLSPYLALGAISVRTCLAAAFSANRGDLEGGSPGLSSWISELAWRDFYRHVLVGFPRVSKGHAFRTETESIAWLPPDETLDAWREGRTGVPFVDAGMRQLVTTGWMHNRLRMVTAMFLAKHLLVDWRHGERFFMRQLIDGDLASNNGGWQWVASTGTDAAPYFRVFNPWTQGRRFDSDATFVKRFVPQLDALPASVIHKPEKLEAARREGLDYPAPIVEHSFARRRAITAFQAVRSAG